MSDIQEQPDWWRASDGRWYPPQGDPPMAPPVAGGFQSPPVGMYFDPVSGLVLPDGVELASVERRIAAFFLSLLLIIITLGIGYLIWGLILWGGGRTPALQVLRMRCWRPQTGQVAGWWWMALREIVGRILLDITALIALVSLILMLVTRRRQALHDLIAGTVVLYDLDGVLRRG